MAISSSLRPILHSIAETVAPSTIGLDDAGWETLDRIVSDAVAARPERMRRQLALFIGAIQWLPLLRYGLPFTRLSVSRRRRVLSFLEDSPLLLIRRGFWGLRTLILMGYYTQSRAATEIGYQADPRGWSRRR